MRPQRAGLDLGGHGGRGDPEHGDGGQEERASEHGRTLYRARVAEPAYTRMQVDERRRQLLELSTELFARHSFAELSMARIAREAGISKALLYHYFPSKQELFVATLAEAAEEVRRRTEPDPDLPPAEALAASLDAFLAWVERERPRLPQAAGERRQRARGGRADRRGARPHLGPHRRGPRRGAPEPQVRTAVRAWLWFIDGAILDWLDHRDLERERAARVCCWARWRER